MKVTPENLLANGYRMYDQRDEYRSELYQKRIRQEDGKTRYFINIWKWTFPSSPPSFQADTTLYSDSPQITMSLKFSIEPEMAIEQVEKVYADAYSLLGCVPDRLNNDD